MSLTTDKWTDLALTASDGVWNIGQIDKPTTRALDRLVRQGRLLKCRGSFCGISPLKTIWCHPGATFSFHEGVHVVEDNRIPEAA